MRGKPINLFMWGYQPHFRSKFELQANRVMGELGVPTASVECLFVGAKRPGRDNRNEVCVEPEDGKWTLSLFDGLLDSIEAEVDRHPLKYVA